MHLNRFTVIAAFVCALVLVAVTSCITRVCMRADIPLQEHADATAATSTVDEARKADLRFAYGEILRQNLMHAHVIARVSVDGTTLRLDTLSCSDKFINTMGRAEKFLSTTRELGFERVVCFASGTNEPEHTLSL